MPAAFQEMLPYLAGGVGVAVLGAVLPAFWRPGMNARAHIQHFAAGIVTAAVGVEILPEVVTAAERTLWLLSAFALGGAFMLGPKWFDHWLEGREAARGKLGLGLALATGALGGVFLLDGASPIVLSMVLSFGAAALLYLVVEELVLYAGPRGHDLLTTAVFFAGFLTIFAFRLLGPHG